MGTNTAIRRVTPVLMSTSEALGRTDHKGWARIRVVREPVVEIQTANKSKGLGKSQSQKKTKHRSYTKSKQNNHEYATSHTPRFAELVYPQQQHWRPFQRANRKLPICGKPELNKDSCASSKDAQLQIRKLTTEFVRLCLEQYVSKCKFSPGDPHVCWFSLQIQLQSQIPFILTLILC